MELLIALGVLVVLGFWIVSIYNQLVALKNRYENGFSQIEIQLKRRYDLIPNLVETAKGYMSHERETLESVIQARNQAMNGLQSAVDDLGNPQAIKELSSAEGLVTLVHIWPHWRLFDDELAPCVSPIPEPIRTHLKLV